MCRFVQGLSTQGLFLLFALSVVGCHDPQTPKDDETDIPKLSLKVEVIKAPGISLASKTLESFADQDTWAELATMFLERWATGKPLKQIQYKEKYRKTKYMPPLMPCLGLFKKLPDWMDHEKVFEPTFGKFVKVLSFSVKEVEKPKEATRQKNAIGTTRKAFKDGPRYYLEAVCQWERATAIARFSFTDPNPNSKAIFISGFWLLPAPKGPPLPAARSNGYIIGQEMMRLAGYAEREQINSWRNRAGVSFQRQGWACNFFLPVYIDVYRAQDTVRIEAHNKTDDRRRQFHGGWQVKWWFDPTSSSLTSPGQAVMIEGKQWVRYYDPKEFMSRPNNDTPLPFGATPGNYRFSIEIPKKTLTPYDSKNKPRKGAKPISSNLAVFSNVISIDNSTSALDILVRVPESIQQRRREIIRKVIAESKFPAEEQKAKNVSLPKPMRRLKDLLSWLHSLSRHNCVAGLSYKTRFESTDESRLEQPEDVTEIDLYAEFSIGCDCCSDVVCSGVTDLDITFFDAFTSLEVLRLPWAKIEGPGLAAIKNLENLRELELSCNALSDYSLRYLSGLKNLETLYLCETDITGTGLRYLNPKKHPKLKKLYLNGCYLSPEGWAALGNLTQLEHLGITALKCGNKPTGEYLSNLSKLQNLKTLDLGSKTITIRDRTNFGFIPATKRRLAATTLVDFKDLVRWIGPIPNLTDVYSLRGYSKNSMNPVRLRHFRNPAILGNLDVRINIATDSDEEEQQGKATQSFTAPPSEVLSRFDAIKHLTVHARYASKTPAKFRNAEIGGMKSLTSLSVSLDEPTAQLHIYDMPNLKKLYVFSRDLSFWQAAYGPLFTPVKLGRLHLENLPMLQCITICAPDELVLKGVGTDIRAAASLSPKNEVMRSPKTKCKIYGKLTPQLAKSLVSLDFLQGLVVSPSADSIPASLEAFRAMENLFHFEIRIRQNPEEWIKNVTTLQQITSLKFLSPRHPSSGQKIQCPQITAQALTPLEKMTKLRFLELCDVFDPTGEPLPWLGKLPELQNFRMSNYDIKKLCIDVPDSQMQWWLGNGHIETFVLSGWSKRRVNLYDLGYVKNLVLRDMPYVMQIETRRDKGTETIRLEGKLPHLRFVNCPDPNVQIMVDKSADTPAYLPAPAKN